MKEKFIVFNNIQELFNISSLLFDNLLETRNHLIICARTVSASISAQDLVSFCFRTSTLEWDTAQDFCSKIDHIPKSIGFKSRENGDHSSLGQNDLKLSLHQFWTNLAV